MGWLLIIVGLLLLLATIKATPRNEKDAKAEGIIRRHKWKHRIGGIILLLIGLSLVVPEEKQQISDNQLFNDFYQDLKNKAKEFDITAEPFFTALQNNDWVSATQIAKNTKTILGQQWLAISNAKIPKFKDKKLREEVKKAKDDISFAYMYKHKAIESFLKLVKDPSTMIVRIAEMKEQTEKFQVNLIVGVSKLETISSQLKSKNKNTDAFKSP